MQPIKGFDSPSQVKVKFAPGGKHLMIWGINAAAKTQGKLPFTFIFSNGERIIYEAVLRQPGDAAGAPPPRDEHRGHKTPPPMRQSRPLQHGRRPLTAQSFALPSITARARNQNPKGIWHDPPTSPPAPT